MKFHGSMILRPTRYEHFYVLLIIFCITFFQSNDASDRYLSNKNMDKKEDAENIKDIQESKIDQSESIDSVYHRSTKITNESDSPALRSFLKNILKARDELKWIDRTADRPNQPNPFIGSNNAIFDKRNAMKEQRSSNDFQTFSSNDRFDSIKNLEYGRNGISQGWIRDYEIPRTNDDISDLKMIYTQDKRESTNNEESLEELKQTVLELKENLTRRNDNSERNKGMEKAILNNNEDQKFTEKDSMKRVNKDERNRDPSFSRSKGEKHAERSNVIGDKSTKLSWLNGAESPEEIIESDESPYNVEKQDRSVILLRNKRTNLRNDFLNEEKINLYKRRKRSKEIVDNKKQLNLKDDSYYEKEANQDHNDYWRKNNYKELTNVDDLIAQQAKFLYFDNTNNKNNNNVPSETERMVKRKSPERRLFWIIEKEMNNRSLSDDEEECFIGKKNQRRILQSYEENLEEDFLSNEEDSERNEISKVAKSCQGKNDERKLDYQKSPINRDQREQRNNIEESLERNENEENDAKRNLKIKRGVRTASEKVKNPYEARVNMMIKQRIALRHKDEKSHVRRKRYPLGIIEYYDYDEEMDERSRESQAVGNDRKNDDQKDNPIDLSFDLDENLRESQNETLMKKQNEHAEELEKEKKRKEKMKNKEPKQQFLVDLEQRARAKNGNPSKSLRSKVTFEGMDEEDKSSQMDREKSFLNEAAPASGQPRDEKSSLPGCQTKWSSNDRRKEQDENDRPMEEPNRELVSIEKVVPKESLEYIFRAPETLEREIVDVVFGDAQPIDLSDREKKLDSSDKSKLENRLDSKKFVEKEYDDIDNVYDELKKLYDWEDNENKYGPRLKGDQRMHQDASEDDLEKETNTNNNNSNNTSASNYLALKKTDDLFKGGVEQSDIFEELSSNGSHKHRQNSSNNYGGNVEWKVIPVVETINDSGSKSSGVVRSRLSKRKTAPENDSGSPYENGKYLDSMNELEENVSNVIDGDKRSVLESKDMHESFVDRIDDFDDDLKIRLGRGLKTIDEDPLKNSTTFNDRTSEQFLPKENLTTTINDKDINIFTNYQISPSYSSSTPSSSSSSSSSRIKEINDNSNATVDKNQIIENNTKENNSSVNSIETESSGLQSTFKPPALADRNASRVKREGNSYSLTNNQGNPYETYRRSKDLSNDLYDINPYKYKGSKDTQLKYNSFNDLYNRQNEDIFKNTNIEDRKKMKKKIKRNKKNHQKNKKIRKKKRKKKRKKNTNWKISKKRGKNWNEFDDFLTDSRRKRKLWKHSPISNFRDTNWKDRVKKWQQYEKRRNKMRMKKKKKKKKRKQAKRMGMKANREMGTIKGIRRNSNGDNVFQRDRANDQNTMREKETENEDTHRKKLAMLLTADNIEDESQMDLALHGELAGKIVENIFEQVQRNEALKAALGPGLYRKNKPENTIETDKIYHQEIDENEIKHTEKTMKKVMELLGRLILDEVQKKTCATLPSDMQQFLEWILKVNGANGLKEQPPLLPLVHDQETTEHPVDDKTLSPKPPDEKKIDKDVNELDKKVRILQNLINEYNALSAKEKIKVQTVHDYLVRQLNLLLHYIEMKEKSKKNETSTFSRTEGVRRNAGFILRYQGASPKLKFDRNITISEDPKVSEFWKLNNTSFTLDIERNKRRPVRSYNNYYDRPSKKKRKKRKKRKRKRRRRPSEINYDRKYTPEYRKLAHRAAMIREKRYDNLEDEWNQFDFRYEQPEIYKSMNILNNPIGKIRNERSTDVKKKREIVETDNVTVINFYNNHFDELPVKGKNRAEDEMILLNKREAWKKENERQLEEVAFGKDMRNKFREEEQFERLTGIKGNKMLNLPFTKSREKRENIREGQNFIRFNLNNVTLNINTTTGSYNEPTTINLSPDFVNTKIMSLEKRDNTSDDKNETLKMNEELLTTR